MRSIRQIVVRVRIQEVASWSFIPGQKTALLVMSWHLNQLNAHIQTCKFTKKLQCNQSYFKTKKFNENLWLKFIHVDKYWLSHRAWANQVFHIGWVNWHLLQLGKVLTQSPRCQQVSLPAYRHVWSGSSPEVTIWRYSAVALTRYVSTCKTVTDQCIDQ